MIPLALQAWLGVGIAGCVAGIYELRAEVRAIHVPKLPAKWRRAAKAEQKQRPHRHRMRWWQRHSTMERWALQIQRTQEAAEIYLEPDWLDQLREQWQFGQVDEFDRPPVGGVATYAQLQPAVLEGAITQEFRRMTSQWGTPVEADEWAAPELAEVSR